MIRCAKVIFVLGLCSFVLGVFGYLGVKSYYVTRAHVQARDIIAETSSIADKLLPDAYVIALTKYVYEHFEKVEPSTAAALKLRPYITNIRLPIFLRYPNGAIEILVKRGLCDNASRMLAFILAERGYETVQWNMITPTGAHSALLVSMPDGRRVLVDPFLGVVAYDAVLGILISPLNAKKKMQQDFDVKNVFLTLSDMSETDFYQDFGHAFMAAQGDDLTITAHLPLVNKAPIILGDLDSNDLDVKAAGNKHGMTPFWHYAGHKYNREWVRVLKSSQNVRLEMTLVSDVEEGIITSEPLPEIIGNKMIWDLKAGDEIKFRDARAQISWRRLNSFIGVDQITIYP